MMQQKRESEANPAPEALLRSRVFLPVSVHSCQFSRQTAFLLLLPHHFVQVAFLQTEEEPWQACQGRGAAH